MELAALYGSCAALRLARESWGLRRVLAIAAASMRWRYNQVQAAPGTLGILGGDDDDDATRHAVVGHERTSRKPKRRVVWLLMPIWREKGTRVRRPSSVAQTGTGANVLNVCYRLRMEGRQGGRPGVDGIPVGCQKVPPCRCTYEYCSRQARRWVGDSAPKPPSRRGSRGVLQRSRQAEDASGRGGCYEADGQLSKSRVESIVWAEISGGCRRMTLSELAGVNNKRQRLRSPQHRNAGSQGRKSTQSEAGDEMTFGTQH